MLTHLVLLLCFHRRVPKLPAQVPLAVVLPLLMDDACVAPQELWELEDAEVGQANDDGATTVGAIVKGL